MKTALLPGHFDPLTFGHIRLLERSLNHFDSVIFAIMENPNKKSLLNLKKREPLIYDTLNHLNKHIKILSFNGALIHLLKKLNINTIIRGIRNFSDVNYEFQFAQVHRVLSKQKVDFLYLISDPDYAHISSSIAKELIHLKMQDELSNFLPKKILEAYMK